MPREPIRRNAQAPAREPRPAGVPRADADWAPPPAAVDELRPWIDLDLVGPVGFYRWLHTMLPLLPRPGTSTRSIAGPEERIGELARALADCAQSEARTHFQASEYFRENAALARRVKALEAILRTARATAPPPDAEAEAATERYLPSGSTE